MSNDRPKICLVGAPLDSGNLGVSALGVSFLSAIAHWHPNAEVTVFDYGRGTREGFIHFSSGPFRYRMQGAMHTKRMYRRESYMRMRLDGWLGGLGNPGVNAVRQSDAIVDVSGGDSFSDIYGTWRFNAVTLPKIIALEQKRPLVLLPQTYGPFQTPSCLRTATDVVQRSKAAWARDAQSFERLKQMLGPDRQHIADIGVDMAFALPVVAPESKESSEVLEWIKQHRQADTPVIALNVSGLLMNEAADAPQQQPMHDKYRKMIRAFIQKVLRESNAAVLLVPHVIAKGESDITACNQVCNEFDQNDPGRLKVVQGISDPREIKYVISQCDWCSATRMHASIASLSTHVPTLGLAYSDKMQPVFEGCGVGAEVLDLRTDSAESIVEGMWKSWQNRKAIGQTLESTMPEVCNRAHVQMRKIIEAALGESARLNPKEPDASVPGQVDQMYQVG